jgi:hypothetical protein
MDSVVDEASSFIPFPQPWLCSSSTSSAGDGVTFKLCTPGLIYEVRPTRFV